MIDHCLDVTNPYHAYMYGLIQTDGHMSSQTRDRGKVRIELSEQDRIVLETFVQLIPYHSKISTRTRMTNFSQQHASVIWSSYDKRFRDCLVSLGMVYGKKSDVIAPPSIVYSKVDYFRGIIDGDGSVGMTAQGFPFLSLVTASQALSDAFIAFLQEYTGKTKALTLNKRDRVYNIMISKEDAKEVASILYYDGCLALTRKMQAAQNIQFWQRPENMRKRDFPMKDWSSEEDSYILSHSIEESMNTLQRTSKSIKTRLWRLYGSNK